ncbi:hypothetical protein [Streptomyces sp. NPDC097619]|uniref:hypothetical protein n=1 Tax=Streptomyces sp. NPDC097619 TaxID=3157228 RepID=UPI0033293E4B
MERFLVTAAATPSSWHSLLSEARLFLVDLGNVVSVGASESGSEEHGIIGFATNIGRASLPEFLGGLAVLLVLAAVGALVKNRRGALRRYTLLNSVDSAGSPLIHVTTRRAGTVIRREAGGAGAERFELTDVLLPDGTYAAEPLDRYLP